MLELVHKIETLCTNGSYALPVIKQTKCQSTEEKTRLEQQHDNNKWFTSATLTKTYIDDGVRHLVRPKVHGVVVVLVCKHFLR